MSVTIQEIAQRAGVSNAMVSRALNGSGPVRPDKKRRILELAEAMGYIPNQATVSLRRAKTNTIGLFFSSINRSTSPYALHQILSGIYDAISPDYQILIGRIDRFRPGSLNPSFYDGILVLSQSSLNFDFLSEIIEKQIPAVGLSRRLPVAIPSVITDESDGMAQAMSHLIAQGHRKIGVIEGPQDLESTLLRHAGWWTAAKAHKLAPEQFPQESGNFRYRSGKLAAHKLLTDHPYLTALCCFNDEMALGAIDAALELGLNVPADLSITGYDNWDFAGHSDPRLTTIERNTIQIAIEGTRALLRYIETGVRPNPVILKGRLVIRDSVQPPRIRQAP